MENLRAALGSLDADGPQDPQDVADAIARAEMIVGAKSAMSLEDFETAMRSTINWYD